MEEGKDFRAYRVYGINAGWRWEGLGQYSDYVMALSHSPWMTKGDAVQHAIDSISGQKA